MPVGLIDLVTKKEKLVTLKKSTFAPRTAPGEPSRPTCNFKEKKKKKMSELVFVSVVVNGRPAHITKSSLHCGLCGPLLRISHNLPSPPIALRSTTGKVIPLDGVEALRKLKSGGFYRPVFAEGGPGVLLSTDGAAGIGEMKRPSSSPATRRPSSPEKRPSSSREDLDAHLTFRPELSPRTRRLTSGRPSFIESLRARSERDLRDLEGLLDRFELLVAEERAQRNASAQAPPVVDRLGRWGDGRRVRIEGLRRERDEGIDFRSNWKKMSVKTMVMTEEMVPLYKRLDSVLERREMHLERLRSKVPWRRPPCSCGDHIGEKVVGNETSESVIKALELVDQKLATNDMQGLARELLLPRTRLARTDTELALELKGREMRDKVVREKG